MSVVVIGGTGATGKQLVRSLVSAPVSFKFTTQLCFVPNSVNQ